MTTWSVTSWILDHWLLVLVVWCLASTVGVLLLGWWRTRSQPTRDDVVARYREEGRL